VASLVGIGFGSLSLGLAAEALAQTASKPAMLSRIVVEGQGLVPENRSSRKATASLEDTPQTVTVIPEQVYKEQSARNLSDVLRNTPGITYNGGENGFATGAANFSMRGFESGSNVFIDGVRDSGNYNRDIFNLEAVEVVKGPAGENGRGGPGGYVNLVTKTPKSTDAYHGSLSYGFDRYDSKPRLRATSDMNKVFSDSVAARLNLMVEDGGVAGRDVAKARAWGVAPSVTFGLAPRTSATLAYSHLETRDRPDFGVPTSPMICATTRSRSASTATISTAIPRTSTRSSRMRCRRASVTNCRRPPRWRTSPVTPKPIAMPSIRWSGRSTRRGW
jgi:catecholate siderophore receptor